MHIKLDNISTQSNQQLAGQLYQRCRDHQKILTTAESCTGGLVSAHITDIAGSSAVFDRAFITYSNAAKQEMLNVSQASLMSDGAVSETVALEMLQGAMKNSSANLGVAITGIAGPDGGSNEKPVGMVCFAWGDGAVQLNCTEHFSGDRQQVRFAAVKFAFEQLLAFISKHPN